MRTLVVIIEKGAGHRAQGVAQGTGQQGIVERD